MAYRELEPPVEIAPHVACLWVRDPQPAARLHRIVPDACADIVWITGERLIVAGPSTGPVLSTIPAGGSAVGVRFRVGAAGSALGVPARELLDGYVALDDVWGAAGAELAERLDAASGAEAAAALLSAAVARRLPPPDAIDPIVRAAAIGAARPRTPVEALGAGLGIGERQLRRRFDDAVGYGPKTLQRVLRFQRFLALAQPPADRSAVRSADRTSDRSGARWADGSSDPRGVRRSADGTGALDLARLAFEAGYADQAHLTRECRRLAGLPPAALLATGAGPSGERSAAFAAGPATLAA
jgi:AraC-like DNA-binding protein